MGDLSRRSIRTKWLVLTMARISWLNASKCTIIKALACRRQLMSACSTAKEGKSLRKEWEIR